VFGFEDVKIRLEKHLYQCIQTACTVEPIISNFIYNEDIQTGVPVDSGAPAAAPVDNTVIVLS